MRVWHCNSTQKRTSTPKILWVKHEGRFRSGELFSLAPGSVGIVHDTTLEIAGWSSWSAREPHKLEVTGSNPVPASNYKQIINNLR